VQKERVLGCIADELERQISTPRPLAGF